MPTDPKKQAALPAAHQLLLAYPQTSPLLLVALTRASPAPTVPEVQALEPFVPQLHVSTAQERWAPAH